MAKDLNNMVSVTNGDMEMVRKLLDNGKTVELAVHKGPIATNSINNGYMDYLKANLELVSNTAPAGSVCGCGKPADTTVRLWR